MNVAGSVGPNDMMTVAASREVCFDERVKSPPESDARTATRQEFFFAVAARNANVTDSAPRTARIDDSLERRNKEIKFCKSSEIV